MRIPRELFLAAAILVAACSGRALAQDPAERRAQAIDARESGQFDKAIALLEALDRDNPDNPETLRLLGSSYAFRARYGSATSVLERARALAPRDQDIALALGRAYLWSGKITKAQAIADGIAVADPANPELAAMRAAIAAGRADPGRTMGFAVGHGISRIATAGGKSTWHETVLGLDAPIGARTTLSADANVENRTGIIDTRMGLRLDRRLGRSASFYVAGSGTPRSDFRERWGIKIGGETLICPNIAISLDLHHAAYRATNVTVAEPGIRWQASDGHQSLTVRAISLWGENDIHRTGWSVRGEVSVAKDARLTLGAATYPDTEAGITRRVRGIFVGTAIPLTAQITLRVVADHERRVASYRRSGLALSLVGAGDAGGFLVLAHDVGHRAVLWLCPCHDIADAISPDPKRVIGAT